MVPSSLNIPGHQIHSFVARVDILEEIVANSIVDKPIRLLTLLKRTSPQYLVHIVVRPDLTENM